MNAAISTWLDEAGAAVPVLPPVAVEPPVLVAPALALPPVAVEPPVLVAPALALPPVAVEPPVLVAPALALLPPLPFESLEFELQAMAGTKRREAMQRVAKVFMFIWASARSRELCAVDLARSFRAGSSLCPPRRVW
jgi:hypothetical protein